MSAAQDRLQASLDELSLGGNHPIQVIAPRADVRAVLEENERLREVAHASAELMEVLLRGSPGWLDTPAGRRLVEAGAALDHKETT